MAVVLFRNVRKEKPGSRLVVAGVASGGKLLLITLFIHFWITARGIDSAGRDGNCLKREGGKTAEDPTLAKYDEAEPVQSYIDRYSGYWWQELVTGLPCIWGVSEKVWGQVFSMEKCKICHLPPDVSESCVCWSQPCPGARSCLHLGLLGSGAGSRAPCCRGLASSGEQKSNEMFCLFFFNFIFFSPPCAI